MSLQALILDLDGTLADTGEAHRHAFNTSFEAHGLSWHWDRDDYRQLLQIPGDMARLRAYQETLPLSSGRLSQAELAAIHAEKTARFGAILAQGETPLRPGVRALIDTARRRGLRLALATTTARRNVEALTRAAWQAPADGVFDVIVAGDDAAAPKPAPDVYLLALERLGLPAGACLAFEDSRDGLRAAAAAGLGTVVAPSPDSAGEAFTGAELVVGDLADPRVQALIERLG